MVLAGLLALLIPVALLAISRALSGKPSAPANAPALVQSDNPAAVGRKTNARIFQTLSAASVLILIALLMVPCAVVLPKSYGLICIFSLSLLAGLALLY